MIALANAVLYEAWRDLLGKRPIRVGPTKRKAAKARKQWWLRERARVFLTTDNVLLRFWASHAGLSPAVIQGLAQKVYDGELTDDQIIRLLSYFRSGVGFNHRAGDSGEAEDLEGAEESAEAGV